MVDAYEQTGGAMVAAMEVPADKTSSYGILDVDQDIGPCVSVRGMVEKPAEGTAPSNLAVIGRYILPPSVMDSLDTATTGAGGEIQLTDAIAREIDAGRPVNGLCFEGDRFDCGSKAGFLQATVAFALARDDLREELLSYLGQVTAIRQAAQ